MEWNRVGIEVGKKKKERKKKRQWRRVCWWLLFSSSTGCCCCPRYESTLPSHQPAGQQPNNREKREGHSTKREREGGRGVPDLCALFSLSAQLKTECLFLYVPEFLFSLFCFCSRYAIISSLSSPHSHSTLSIATSPSLPLPSTPFPPFAFLAQTINHSIGKRHSNSKTTTPTLGVLLVHGSTVPRSIYSARILLSPCLPLTVSGVFCTSDRDHISHPHCAKHGRKRKQQNHTYTARVSLFFSFFSCFRSPLFPSSLIRHTFNYP